MAKQLKLFDAPSPYRVARPESLPMNREQLVRWKDSIFAYQQTVKVTPPPQQTTLFELATTTWHQPDEIDPFVLPSHSSLFWRQASLAEPLDSSNQGYLYFILDRSIPLLLYVGETKLTPNQRWQGTHDCKDYILQYIELHRRHQLTVEVVSAFWPHIPPQKKILQQWERHLILKWRSPFNKECWQWWGKPFGS
jgi:hypothetical protein